MNLMRLVLGIEENVALLHLFGKDRLIFEGMVGRPAVNF